MKTWLIYLMTILVLVGTTVPCCPTDDCETEFSQSTGSHDEPEQGACSPFSSCASCTGFVEMVRRVHVPEPVALVPDHNSNLITILFPVYQTPLFQPPRIS